MNDKNADALEVVREAVARLQGGGSDFRLVLVGNNGTVVKVERSETLLDLRN